MERRSLLWLFFLACQLWKVVVMQSNRQDRGGGYSDQRNLFCDFDHGECFWRHDHSARFSWQYAIARSYAESGPRRDFTPLNSGGSFIRFNTKVKKGPYKASMSTPSLSTSNENSCLTFGYFMYGHEVGGLNVWKYYSENDEKKLLFSIFGSQGKRWYQAFVPIGIGQNFTLEIEGTYHGKEGDGDIALDDTDIRLDATSCHQNTQYEPRFDCDFDTDFCSWSSYGDWARYNPRDEWISGHLAYPFNPWNQRYQATIDSKTISVLGKGACFTFKFSNQDSPGSRVVLYAYSYGQQMTKGGKILWSSPRRARVSAMAAVTIPPGENIRLVFSLMQHKRREGYFRVDDFKLWYKGPCTPYGFVPEQMRMYQCDFDDNSTCEWFQRSLPGVGKWKVHQGPTGSEDTGPNKDHTRGDGLFAYLESSRVDIAQLYSPMVNIPGRGACFSFWYHMHGEDINQLTVWRYNHSAFLEDMRKEILWQAEGSKGHNWIQQNVTISEAGRDMIIVLEATRGYFPRGDIAVDDLVLSLGRPCYGDSLTTTIIDNKTTSKAITSSTTTSVDTTQSPTPGPDSWVKAPEIIVTGLINPAPVGSIVRLECGQDDETVEWTLANPMKRFQERTSVTGPHVLLLDEIGRDDENIFTCKVSKGKRVSSPSKPVHIKVVNELRARPEIKSKDSLDPAVVGSQITLRCGHRLDGTTRYKWTIIHVNETISTYVSNSRYFVIQKATSEYNGRYHCIVLKDGFQTAMSNPVTINVAKGRVCQSHFDCLGLDGYTGECVRDRCVCLHEELLGDTTCLTKPPTPVIDVVPPFDTFGVGEHFNLRCRTKEPLHESASYHFHRNGTELSQTGRLDRFYVYSISKASASDSGFYTCSIKYNEVSSEPSSNIYSIQIKEFTDLSCAFEKDLCNWYHEDALKIFHLKPFPNSDEDSSITSDGNYFLSSGLLGAFLRSPDIPMNSFQSCLKFRYRMDSPDAISLSVWIYKHSLASGEPATGKNVWEAVGRQGTKWRESSIDVEPSTNFYILFQSQGRVAIDKFQYSNHGAC